MNLSFLDVISCGFGAVILLLVISKIGEPSVISKTRAQLEERLAVLSEALKVSEIKGEALKVDIATDEKSLQAMRRALQRAQAQFSVAMQNALSSGNMTESESALRDKLYQARQRLTDAMQRLAETRIPSANKTLVGGIPADSEYVIFVIDTSGSMQAVWPNVLKKISEVLAIYPKLRGIQIMNDQGTYMFPEYKREWIPDSPVRRNFILRRLNQWTPFSESSPVKGIVEAISQFSRYGHNASIYVFGDEYTGSSIETVVSTVRQMNRDRKGNTLFRIHTVGFFTGGQRGHTISTNSRFAHLMRLLAEDNGGAFVGVVH